MSTLHIIKLCRAIRQLSRAITPGTDPDVARSYALEAFILLQEVLS